MDEKEHSIRFINSSYDTLFRIPDGGTVEVQFPDRKFTARCKYLDDYHTVVGNSVFHICEFAELIEGQNGTVRPEPEIMADQAAWQLSHRDYLAVEKEAWGFRYELFTPQFQSTVQGQIDDSSLTMNQAREQILDSLNMSHRNRRAIPFQEVMDNARSVSQSVLNELNRLESRPPKTPNTEKEKTHVGKETR